MKRVTFLVLMALLAAAVVQAQPGPRGRRGDDRMQRQPCQTPAKQDGCDRCCGPRGGFPGLQGILSVADEINLTADQKTKLQRMMMDFRMAGIDQRAQVEKAEIRLHALMMDDNAAEGDVLAAMDDVSRFQAEMHKMRYRHHRAAREVLTSAQIEKLKKLHQERVKACTPSPGKGMGCGMVPGMKCGKGPGMGMGCGKGPGAGCGMGPGMGFVPDDDDM
ncbi:MAG TPA: Spy/CpxP family protein refolding chaperone [Candidatus Deferrimicrobium sp.]|nr:Spy/CpxP family protein refolding chaperone [Candidatus Deferrimicrobium sp.]